MTKKLLITGTLFVTDSQVDTLKDAGYDVSRFAETAPSDDALIAALEGVSVYIKGDFNLITERIIESTDTLEAIIFPAVDYLKFIPAADLAAEKGIKLLNSPGANAASVAEFALGTALVMQRQLYSISRVGQVKSATTKSFEKMTVGFVGAGNIGKILIDTIHNFRPSEMLYYNRSEKDVDARRVELSELVQQSDVIFLTLPMSAGQVFNAVIINQIKDDALLVSMSPNNLIDYDALLVRLQNGTLRAAIDWPSPKPEFDELSSDVWLSYTSHSAYNTHVANDNVNESVVATAITLI